MQKKFLIFIMMMFTLKVGYSDNKIIVFVNKDVITSNELDTKVTQLIDKYKQKKLEIPKNIREIILEQLILQKIQLDMASRTNIKASDIEINQQINTIAKAQKVTIEQLRKKPDFLEFKDQITKEIIIEKLKQREIGSKLFVSEAEVDRILNSDTYKKRINYDLSYIIIAIPSIDKTDVKKELIARAYQELENGKSFTQVVNKYSDNQANDGKLGWRSNVTLPVIVEESLKNLKTGEYTKVISLPNGLFIFKINAIKKLDTVKITKQYLVKHILVKIGQGVSEKEAHYKIKLIKAKLDAANSIDKDKLFDTFAKKYSNDASSTKSGDIGWIGMGETVPIFENIVVSLPIGKISQPVKTPYGWHIIKVVNSREIDLKDKDQKNEIFQELRNNKAITIYSQWLRDIREAAFVKYNDKQ